MRILFKLFFFLVSPMLWAQGNPPATLPTPSGDCDPYFDGLIKQTKASVFSPIESGSNAVIYLDNSRMATGVTYFAINKTTGMWFAGSYDTTLFMVTIPVGVLTQNTTFEVHAIAGGCSFKVVDDVTFEVKPTTEVHLQTRVRDEYCDNSGGIYYQMMGDSNDNYNFYHKLSTQTAFQTATADRNDLQTVQGGKTYVIRAELKTDSNTFYEKTITVKDAKVPNPPGIEYTITAQPILCGANTGRAIVNITKGVSYPFTFKITYGPETRPEQSSNVFENLPAGNYTMYVKDACGQGRTVSFRIDGQAFYIGPIGGYSWLQPTDECGRGLVKLQRGIKMSGEHWYTDAIPYPMTVSYTLTSPSGASYAMTRTFNNRTELVAYTRYDDREASIYFYHNAGQWMIKDFFGDGVQIPFEKGNWTHNFQVTTACGTHNLAPLIEKAISSEDDFNHWARVDKAYDTCGKTYIYATVEWFFRPAYIVLDEAPAGFDPVAAGFTKNHRFGGRYYKYGQLDHRHFHLVNYPHLLLGDYKFTYVHAACGFEVQRQITVTDLQNPAGVSNRSYFYSTYYCENESFGIGFVQEGNSGAPQKIRITGFTPAPGTSGTFAVPQEYDYDQWTTIVGGRRVLHSLPFGTYTLSALDFECQQDVVDKVVTVQPPTRDPKVRFSMATGCKVQVELYDAVGDSYQRSYWLQGYDEDQARWVNMVAPNDNPYGDIISDKKQNIIKVLNHNNYKVYTRYRVVELTGTVGLHSTCPKVLGEYTPPSELPTLVDIVGATCGLNQYQIMVVASGGTPPFTYKILSRSVGGSLDTSFVPITNTTGKFTITETNPSASYKFAVEDVCNQETKDVEIRNMTPFVITTDRTEYCQGTSATLSVPDLSLAYNYQWFREDDPSTILSTSPTLQVSNLQATDFAHKYKLRVAPKDASFTLCIPAEYEVQLTGSTASVPVLTGDATNVVLCASELDGKTSYDIRTNLFATVHNNATASGYTNGVIREISGMYPVSQDGLMALHKNMIPVLEGQTFTFTYTISNACGLEATKTATLTVKRNIKPEDLTYVNHNAFRVCDADLTNWVTFGATNFSDLAEFIKNHNAARTTDVIEFFSDPQGNTPVHQLDFTTESVKIIYYKINRADYCSSVARIRIDKLSTYKRPDGTDDPRLVDLSYDTCANGVTVQDVRARLQQIFGRYSIPKVYLIRMVGGVETSSELPDNYALTTSEVYRYRMEDGGCPSSWRNITLNFNQTNIVTQPVSHIVCSGEQVVLTALGASTSPPTAGKMIYKWFESTYNGTIGATPVHAQTLNRGEVSTYTPSTASVGAKYYFVEVTVENVCNVPMYTNIVKVEVKGMTASVPTVTTLSSVQCGEDVKFTFTGVPNEEVHYTVNGVASTITLPTSGVYTHTVSAATTTQVLRVVSVSNASGCPTTPTTGNVYTVTVNDLPTPTINVVNATCGNSGSATITNYDPTLTYTFSGSGVTHTGATITGFALGTTYTMTVSNGTCTKATSFVVNTTCTIDAVDDPLIEVDALSTHRTSVISILDNDVLGTLSATTANVTITQLSTTDARVNIDPATGKIRLTNSTVPTGIYTITYRICEEVNDTPCDTATITVKVRNIKAENDVVSYIAGVIADNILYNDTYNNKEAFDYYNDLKITITSPLPSGVTVEPGGDFKITESVRSGVYTFTYQICSEVLPDVCDSATVTLTVRNIISAYDDDDGDYLNGYSVVPNNTIDIFENDRLNSHFVTSQTVTISSHTALPTGVTIDANGIVTIGNDTPTGVHSFTYVLCEKDVTPPICDSAKVLFTVKNINADNDDFEVSAGGNTGSVLNNDKYDGEFLSSTTSVTLTPIGMLPSGISLDPITGIVRVASGTPSGNYSFNYEICSKVVPSLCDEATVTIRVKNSIIADDDNLGTVVSGGTTTQTVISNDKLNGTLVVIGTEVGKVTLTPIVTPTGITIDATNGKVTVGTNVSSGVYTLTYKICENGATPDNCDEATVTITVQNSIVADNDDLGTVVSGGTTTQTVISNDKLNGTSVVIGTEVGKVTLTPLITPTGITIDATNGKVTVGTNVSSGVYTLTYKICENGATPDNCDEATV
ncbi:hypothetical protein, partial [Capnocytophaga canimorsus]|uniref:hypothetical protein n=1 Tax=Capnocytophaga canimorsus TaxID=28188 RepID=UPI0037CDD4DC